MITYNMFKRVLMLFATHSLLQVRECAFRLVDFSFQIVAKENVQRGWRHCRTGDSSNVERGEHARKKECAGEAMSLPCRVRCRDDAGDARSNERQARFASPASHPERHRCTATALHTHLPPPPLPLSPSPSNFSAAMGLAFSKFWSRMFGKVRSSRESREREKRTDSSRTGGSSGEATATAMAHRHTHPTATSTADCTRASIAATIVSLFAGVMPLPRRIWRLRVAWHSLTPPFLCCSLACRLCVEGNAYPHGRSRCRRKDHHPLQTQARRGRSPLRLTFERAAAASRACLPCVRIPLFAHFPSFLVCV